MAIRVFLTWGFVFAFINVLKDVRNIKDVKGNV